MGRKELFAYIIGMVYKRQPGCRMLPEFVGIARAWKRAC